MTDFFDTTGAACAGYPTSWWYAQGGAKERLAAAICRTCPLIAPCRDWARKHGEAGTWGGEIEDERRPGGWRPPNGPDAALDHTPPPPSCGTHANYRYGCRCDACTKAYRRVERKRRRDEVKIRDLRRSIGRAS